MIDSNFNWHIPIIGLYLLYAFTRSVSEQSVCDLIPNLIKAEFENVGAESLEGFHSV